MWLDVTVGDAFPMRKSEGLGDVAQQRDRFGYRQLAVSEPGAQRFTVYERHYIVGQTLDVTGGEQRNDMRMLKLGHEGYLASEAADRNGAGQLGGQDFDDDPTSKRRILGDEDARHSGAGELTLDRVGAAE